MTTRYTLNYYPASCYMFTNSHSGKMGAAVKTVGVAGPGEESGIETPNLSS